MGKVEDLERAKRMCRTFIDGEPLYEVLPQMYQNMSGGEISSCLGISRATVSIWVNRLGLAHSSETIERLKSSKKQLMRKIGKKERVYHGMTVREIVLRYFPTSTSGEISDRFGCSFSYVKKVARDLGVKHTEETKKRIYARRTAWRHSLSEEERKMLGEKRRKLFRLEKWRRESGIRRTTKLRISVLTKKQKYAKGFLCARRNYFADSSIDPYALFYDEETIRFSSTYRYSEEYYTKKYGLRFLPADGYEDENSSPILSQESM